VQNSHFDNLERSKKDEEKTAYCAYKFRHSRNANYGNYAFCSGKGAGNIEGGPMVIHAGLRPQEGADPKGAEKLLKEDFIPKMKGVKGMKVKVLKNVKMNLTGYDDPSAQDSDKAAYDYIMMAEIENLGVFMQFMRKSYRGEKGLSAFGDLMKKYAGEPYINSYTIIAETEEVAKTE
jgi:hypothetical protein